ncbi:P-loop containing nucleoside triphosphate hydrolase protein [Lasiosphaeria miniovina]|uniref:P-loop containing nucleoside triphosphate hydrolase protein n=1 Tax=Lasiosphaeria miniovina TaxID=1954250 RepID=A0AA40BJ95_9PEZI|nr:P-loop containing nucleoside triphosphate hydrolase protein [Lasiosphaeria miniovina]KAK0735158.1 P-loop containing nucleoside triphosphate hydrolase protein [Lasiosphaeria miniovina]
MTGLNVAFYLYPCGLFATLAASESIDYFRTRARRQKSAGPGPAEAASANDKAADATRRLYARLIWLCQGVLAILLLPSIVLVIRDAVAGPQVGGFPYSAYLAAHVAVMLYFLAGLLPNPDGPWSPTASHCYSWLVGALLEAVIAALFGIQRSRIDAPPELLDALAALGLARIAALVVMIALLVRRQYALRSSLASSTPGERQGLLENGHAPARPKPRDAQDSGWLDYIAGFRVLFPYLWPNDSRLYQAVVLVCLVLLICQRVVNLMVPLQLGVLVKSLGYGRIPYRDMVLYVVYRALQGNQGAIGAARSVLWIPVSQSLFRRLSCAAFEHVLGLSLDFHLSKKIGEVTSALSRGAAMNSFLENFVFQVFPMIFDIFVAGVLFFVKYDAFYTIIVFSIMWSYIFLTIYMAKYRGRARRDMALKSREMDAVKTDAIMAYETVQHNCAVGPETERFNGHVVIYQRAERLVLWSLNGLNLTQSSIFSVGTAMLVAVSAYKISKGQQTVPEFVTLIAYFTQLQAPLNFFGTYYTMLQNNLIEAERMLDLFKETSGVVEKPDATELVNPRGEVEFRDVKFAYQDKTKPALDGISFKVAPGTKTAIVGESGSGKSTCLKLLFRFYDVDGGCIAVDGHDIRDLQLDSLRRAIGVVPQDTVLFNATIMYNLLYASPTATEADVHEACKAANIHERIMEFPDQYETKVGERGLKLSGGERQRVAIARAILKDARILLLDEATASLDSHTERQIQDALERVTLGRTTVTIAHRLSTITTSDQIVVLHKGSIVERGTHEELLARGGRYHAMWEKQTTAEKQKTEKASDV